MNNEISAGVLLKTKRVVSVDDFVKMVKEQDDVPMCWIQWDSRSERSLGRRAVLLTDKLLQIAESKRIDRKRLAVGFINTEHGANTQKFMDEFVLYDASNGNVEFRVIPYKKTSEGKERAHVYHVSAGWKKPVFSGSWPDVRKWFKQDATEGSAATQEKKPTQPKGPRSVEQVDLPRSVRVPRRERSKVVATEERTHETAKGA